MQSCKFTHTRLEEKCVPEDQDEEPRVFLGRPTVEPLKASFFLGARSHYGDGHGW